MLLIFLYLVLAWIWLMKQKLLLSHNFDMKNLEATDVILELKIEWTHERIGIS